MVVPRFPAPKGSPALTSHKSARERLVIIGSGPAGYTAAIYAARAMLRPLLLAGFEPGGQLMITTDVENYPGSPSRSRALADGAVARASRYVGARIESDYVVALDLGARPFSHPLRQRPSRDRRVGYSRDRREGEMAGTCRARRRSGLWRSACATCDGFFFRGKTVAVVGGGNTAVEEALYLSQIAASCDFVHRRDSFRAERILIERLLANPNVASAGTASSKSSLVGEMPQRRDRVRLRDVATGALEDLAIDGVFVAIGHEPATELVRGQLELNPTATSGLRRVRRRPASRACSPPATSPTTSFGRLSPPRVSAVWRRSRRTVGSPLKTQSGSGRIKNSRRWRNDQAVYEAGETKERHGLG